MKKTIAEIKKASTLDKLMRYEEGVMSRREWLRVKMVQGWEVEEKQVAAIMFDRRKFNRMNGFEQQEYEKRVAEKKTEYRLKNVDAYYIITKTEYDHFKTLQLSDDVMIERMELTHKIEAGIATDEEIEQDERKEFEFFSKYFPA